MTQVKHTQTVCLKTFVNRALFSPSIASGLVSGLTLGLLGMDVNTLEILRRQGSEKEVQSLPNSKIIKTKSAVFV
jgi:hypothetical protein